MFPEAILGKGAAWGPLSISDFWVAKRSRERRKGSPFPEGELDSPLYHPIVEPFAFVVGWLLTSCGLRWHKVYLERKYIFYSCKVSSPYRA